MVEDATVDCHDEDEAATGFFTMFENEFALPFKTKVLGVHVTVENIDTTEDSSIMAICARDGIRQAIRIVDLPLPEPPPAGAEWIAAYRYWLG
jgi:Calcium binding